MFMTCSSLARLVVAVGLVAFTQPLPAQFNSFAAQTGDSPSHIGVYLRDIDADRASALKLASVTGVEVARVEPGGPAERAGIKAGDILLSYNGESILGTQQLGRMVRETPVGRKVKIEYFREGKVSTVMATTAEVRPAPAFHIDFGSADRLFQPEWFPAPRFVWMNQGFGIVCEALDAQEPQLAEFFGVSHGVLIRSVAKDSLAAKTGLRAGDVVTQIGDRAVADPRDIASGIREEQHLAKPFAVEVMRERKPLTLKVTRSQAGQE